MEGEALGSAKAGHPSPGVGEYQGGETGRGGWLLGVNTLIEEGIGGWERGFMDRKTKKGMTLEL